MAALAPLTDLQRLDAAISRRADSIADLEAQSRQIEAALAVSRTSLSHLRASRTFLEKAAAIPKAPSKWLLGRILQHHMEPPVDPTEE